MKASTKWLPEILLGAALLAAVGLLAAPRRPPLGFSPPPASAVPAPAEQPPRASATGRKLAAPGQIASLFGWVEPVAAPRTPAAPARPAEAAWLKPVGFVIGEGGAPSYIFKDTKSNAVLTLVPMVQNKGWILREIREKEFVLVYNGAEFVVKRND
jgi:hypothetical protein